MEAIARLYLEEISQVQPHGPYYLGGYCTGAVVAFEMAQQLRAAGETVACLVLMEPDKPAFPLGERIRLAFERAASLPARERPGYFAYWISDKVRRELGRLHEHYKAPKQAGGTGTVAFEPSKSPVARALLRAQRKYLIRPYPGRIILFRTSNPGNNLSADDNSWIPFAKGGAEIHQIPGEHQTIFEPRCAPMLAEVLDACIRAALDRQASADGAEIPDSAFAYRRLSSR